MEAGGEVAGREHSLQPIPASGKVGTGWEKGRGRMSPGHLICPHFVLCLNCVSPKRSHSPLTYEKLASEALAFLWDDDQASDLVPGPLLSSSALPGAQRTVGPGEARFLVWLVCEDPMGIISFCGAGTLNILCLGLMERIL